MIGRGAQQRRAARQRDRVDGTTDAALGRAPAKLGEQQRRQPTPPPVAPHAEQRHLDGGASPAVQPERGRNGGDETNQGALTAHAQPELQLVARARRAEHPPDSRARCVERAQVVGPTHGAEFEAVGQRDRRQGRDDCAKGARRHPG
eukprot:4130103-Prymnesium_polylepis.1